MLIISLSTETTNRKREICTNCDKMNGDDGGGGNICPADVNWLLLLLLFASVVNYRQ